MWSARGLKAVSAKKAAVMAAADVVRNRADLPKIYAYQCFEKPGSLN